MDDRTIFIDVTSALKQSAGIGRYTRGLITGLLRTHVELPIHLLATRDAPPPPASWQFPFHRLPLNERAAVILWQRLNIPVPVEWLIGKGRVYHSPDFVLPPLRQMAGIVTVHDLSFIVYPQYAVPGLEFYLRKAVPRAVKRARVVLADSQNTKADLVRFWNTPPDKIHVLYPGLDPAFRPIRDEEHLHRVRTRYSLPDRFILSVSRLEPRKNFVGLIHAFERFKARTSYPHHLVIAGGKGWKYEPIFQAAAASPFREAIHFLGFVDDEDLPALYTLADVFAYPTFYEGFGFPPLEAMACGTPVLSSDNSSLPEVVGDGGILLPANDVDAWADALQKILSDDALRSRLIEKGYTQSAKFTWEKSAQHLVRIYRTLMAD